MQYVENENVTEKIFPETSGVIPNNNIAYNLESLYSFYPKMITGSKWEKSDTDYASKFSIKHCGLPLFCLSICSSIRVSFWCKVTD